MIKKIIIGIVVSIAIYFFARTDYTWKDNVLENHKKDWILVTEKSNYPVLTYPWRWFGSPINELLFTKPDQYGYLNENYIYARSKWVKRGEESTESIDLFDTKNKLFTRFNSWEELESFNPLTTSHLKWFEYNQNGIIHNMVTFVENAKEKIITEESNNLAMFDFFGREIDISQLINSGEYSLIDSTDLIFEIRNNNPYVPRAEDEEIIKSGVEKWLNDNYSGQSITLSENLYLNTKYKISRMGFGFPMDIYSLNIKPNSKIGELNLELHFTRQSHQDSGNKIDEVEILNEPVEID